jgi:hypothetical protein
LNETPALEAKYKLLLQTNVVPAPAVPGDAAVQ